MNTRRETLASQRQYLVERSTLCRLRLRRDAFAVRTAMRWNRMPGALATVPAARTIAWSVALSILGTGRAGRVVLFVSRAILVARLTRAAIVYVRRRTDIVQGSAA